MNYRGYQPFPYTALSMASDMLATPMPAVNRLRETWDEFYLGMADYVSTRSKDPSTRVGAVIVRPDRTVASIGYNGFARGVADTPERLADRDIKLLLTVHAERNAILNAREPLNGYAIYTSALPPCARCASDIIQSGMVSVIHYRAEVPERWAAEMALAKKALEEAGVEVREIEDTL